MANVTKRGRRWAARWKDATGCWREKRFAHANKTEAYHFAVEQERLAERQRNGLDPLAGAASEMTFTALFEWWWKEYGTRLKSPTIRAFGIKNLLPTLGALRVRDVTAPKIEGTLASLEDALSPASLNHLRTLLHRIFGRAIKRGEWVGPNPAAGVERRRVPKRPPEFLTPEEVNVMLAALAPEWRPLFAAAVLTGMRKGELLGLQIRDVNLREDTILVTRSYENSTTKGGHSDTLPIAPALKPYLEEALRVSPSSKLVFARPDGSLHRRDLALDKVLRRALGRAGVVSGYDHRCRRKGCGYSRQETHAVLARCPRCDMKLWAKALPRHVRFHDLRHTTGTLLMKAGVPLATVQRVLRHSDPRITAMTYGHLDVSDMRPGLEQLGVSTTGGLAPPASMVAANEPQGGLTGEVVDFSEVLRANLGRASGSTKREGPGSEAFASETGAFVLSGRLDLNQRPLAPQRCLWTAH